MPATGCMKVSMTTDAQLLQDYAAEGAEEAFREFVERHMGLVYSAALRQVGGDAHLAHDVAQTVFTDAARKAAVLSRHPCLAGWLFTSTRFAAAKAVRSEQRRRHHEQEAHAMYELRQEQPLDWKQISSEIDGALAELSEREREAVILRFFERQSFADIGERSAVDPDTARARVQRALEKLRGKLQRRGIGSTAEALAAALAANGAIAAPAGAAGTIAANAVAAASIGAVGTASFVTYMSTKTFIATTTALVCVLAYVSTIAWRQHIALEAGTAGGETVRQDRATLAELQIQNRKLSDELVALRSAKAALDAQARANEPFVDELDRWLKRISQVKAFGASNPGFVIPEMKALTVADWLEVTRDKPLETEADYRMALATLRLTAKRRVSGNLGNALTKYLAASQGELPADTSALAPYLPADFDTAVLAGYTINPGGEIPNMPRVREADPKLKQMGLAPVVSRDSQFVLIDKTVDPVWEGHVYVSKGGAVMGQAPGNALANDLQEAIAKYQKQTGASPTAAGQLTPLLQNPAAATADPAKTNEIFAAFMRKPAPAQTP